MNKLLVVALLACPATALAQQQEPIIGNVAAEGELQRWQLGIAAGVSDSPYAGEGTRVSPFPLVVYEGDNIFWRGTSGGYHAYQGDVFSVDLIVSLRGGFDIDDLGTVELANNGLDAELLEDRDLGLDAGVSGRWRGEASEITLDLLSDVSGASEGHKANLEYAYRFIWGKTSITPGVGVTWLSDKSMQYAYGTLEEEEARGVTAYRPDAAIIPEVSVGFARQIGEKWGVFGSVGYAFLPDEVKNSPLIEPDTDGEATIAIGFARGF